MDLRVKDGDAQESLAEQLRTARNSVELTQQELAERLGVSVRTVQLWERGAASSARFTHRRAIRDFIRFVECEEAA
jgi:DNA-binding transcriptional regulator YiaG